MSKLKGIKDKIFRKYQCDLLKRVFSVVKDGTCVRLSVAEKVLKEAIDEACDYCEKPQTLYDFWGQPIDTNGIED
jgi:hypothetical protein